MIQSHFLRFTFGLDLFDLLEIPSRLMFAIRLKCEELARLAFQLMLELGLPYTGQFSVNIRLTDLAEIFVPLILKLPQGDDGVAVLIAAPF